MNTNDGTQDVPHALVESGKVEQKDRKFANDVADVGFVNYLFIRLVAKGRRFRNVDFRYSVFDACYLRNCVFDSCNFTGCRFVSTNFHGSSFTGCQFDYASFEKTDIDDDVLSSGCPATENLKMRFARSLRINYQQLGNAEAANKAIEVELDATEVYLHKSWRSNESYYRKKYTREKRVKQFFRWLTFKTLDLVWGNGESTYKLLRAVVVVQIAIAIVHVGAFGDSTLVANYLKAIVDAPSTFLGTAVPPEYPPLYVSALQFVKLVFFGFFMSVILKRFNRR